MILSDLIIQLNPENRLDCRFMKNQDKLYLWYSKTYRLQE